MPEDTIKLIIIALMLIAVLVCLSIAEDINDQGFDPFGGEANSPIKSNKSDSGPTIPQVEFNSNDISMVFQIISDATGWSIFPTADVSRAKINLWAKNISAQQLLDTVIKMAGFVYNREGDVITVMTYDEYMQYHGLARRVFELEFANAASIDTVIRPFLTKLGKSVVYNETNTVVLYEAEANLKFIEAVIEQLDNPSKDFIIEIINLKYADSELIAEKLQQLFAEEKTKVTTVGKKEDTEASNSKTILANAQTPHAGSIISPQSRVYIQAIGRTNQLIIRAYKNGVESIKQIIKKLDIYVEPITKNYRLTYIDASEIFDGLEKALNFEMASARSKDSSEKQQGITLVEKTNSILLTGPPSAHRIMTSVVENVDKPSTYETGIIKIYKLENADVEEVAKTISELLEEDSKEERKANSANVHFSQENTPVSQTPVYKTPTSQPSSAGRLAQSEEFVPQIATRVSVSKSTNSIVIQATARQHREIEKLIKELDTKRKQVLIKAMIVELTTTDNLDLGVELSHLFDEITLFTDFGLSANLDPIKGTRDITVSPGGTAAVLSSEKVEAIIHALKRDGKAKITSAPRILVNDHATGLINSIAEEPYTTTQTIVGEPSITSFGGFVEAGTQFTIIPHISENNYLKVEYKITLNSFTSKSSGTTIPPPRSTSSIQSEATVPDGYTIVVGGLQASDESQNVDKVPFLGDVPVLGVAFKRTKIEKQYRVTYLFITPNILEKENFSDLKEASIKALKEIELNGITENADVNVSE